MVFSNPPNPDLTSMTDDELVESAGAQLWADLHSPDPVFGEFGRRCREAHRRGKPELLLRAMAQLVLPRRVWCEECDAVVDSFYNQDEIVCRPGAHIIATFHRKG